MFGPTAVGKTDLLWKLARIGCEVINADSMQVYRGMDIGTAKPLPELRSVLPHHLLDIRNPDEQFTAGEFVHEAERLIAAVLGRGKVPIVSGGTAFYIKNLVCGLPDTPVGDAQIRNLLKERLNTVGIAALYEELKLKDPESAAKIMPKDSARIIRALEVIAKTDRPLSSFRVPDTVRQEYSFLLIGLVREREELYRRIDERVERMFGQGLVEEVKSLLEAGYRQYHPGMQGIGYHEFFSMQKAGCLTMSMIKETIQKNSRRYAKRQITFFKTLPDVLWRNPEDVPRIERDIRAFLSASP